MYLIIFENGDVGKMEKITQSEMDASDAGVLDVIDIHLSAYPRRYVAGEWHLLPDASEGL